MAEMTNLRDLRKQKKREAEPPVAFADKPVSSEKKMRTEGGVIPAQTVTRNVKAPVTRNSKKSAGEKESSLRGSNAKSQKLKGSSSNASLRTGTPIAWFSSLRHEEDQPSDYATFENRAHIEGAWNYMAKFVMENNHVISAYERELRARSDTIDMLQRQLTTAREATDSEKSSLAQKKKKIKSLRASLSEKDELIALLNAELQAAKSSEEQVRKEAELSCIHKVQDRFIQIGEALQELRKGPMYRLNLKGQTENNMSLVKDLLSENPPVLAEEMDALEKEMADYGGATEEFEAAFEAIVRSLLGDDSDFDGVEDFPGRLPEASLNEAMREDDPELGAREKDDEGFKDVDS